ncbi:hypothetical protein BN973_01817 [Mycobacterium rhizamassiliense]|jgi:hypothetical protein|uniref:Uncharacterized protein n=1 Tax=Mycobacterium rhizamassiliense TaxID=1841860 RepID=A0A2U3NLP8_9MYCO|nr:hypothetical protein BN973_01817 [Mycobacterium rhizamassiliense]
MTQRSSVANAIASWLWVGVPFMYGVYQLVAKIPALFTN